MSSPLGLVGGRRLLVVFVLFGLQQACATPPGQEPDKVDEDGVHLVAHEPGECRLCNLYQQGRNHVVRISTPVRFGAGVVITADGMVVTNAHVVKHARSITVETHDGRTFPGKTVAVDADRDLALVEVESNGFRWAPARIGSEHPPLVGSEVYVIGHPVGLGWTMTRGIVSRYHETGDSSMIQTDAAISPGNSGGPLLDREGHVIGVVTSVFVGGEVENVAFAIPASALLEFLSREAVLGERSHPGGGTNVDDLDFE